MKKKSGQIGIAVFLALLIVIMGAVDIVMAVNTKTPKLSQEKMQKMSDAAEKFKSTESDDSINEDEEEYSKTLESFEITGTESLKQDAAKEKKKEQEEKKEEYLCSYTSDRLLTENDIRELKSKTYENLPKEKSILQMVINEMYARYGYQFQNEEIQKYFDEKKWYQNITEFSTNMADIYQNMTEIEKSNVEFLSEQNGED